MEEVALAGLDLKGRIPMAHVALRVVVGCADEASAGADHYCFLLGPRKVRTTLGLAFRAVTTSDGEGELNVELWQRGIRVTRGLREGEGGISSFLVSSAPIRQAWWRLRGTELVAPAPH